MPLLPELGDFLDAITIKISALPGLAGLEHRGNYNLF
jgi:hypothetical protein